MIREQVSLTARRQESTTSVASGPRTVLEAIENLCKEERNEEAESLLKEALESNPENLDLKTMLGIVQSRLHMDEDAETTLRSVLQADQNHEDAVCALGRILDQSLRSKEAERMYRGLLTRRPESHCALDDLCRLLLSEGHEQEALLLARNHTKGFPKDIHAYDGLRYVLAAFEESLVLADSQDQENSRRLTENLLEQFDLILRIENQVDSKWFENEELFQNLKEDLMRISQELEHLLNTLEGYEVSVDDRLRERVKQAISIAKRQRQNGHGR
ncbi:MAG: tetratricopeptide repeat protein [Candidatus Thorarchaeota archaeon]